MIKCFTASVCHASGVGTGPRAISLFTICLMTGNVDVFFLHCRECLESNIGLVIKRLIFSALNISFPTERLARRSNLWNVRGADEQNVVAVVCQDNVKILISRKCHDNIRANKKWMVGSLNYYSLYLETLLTSKGWLLMNLIYWFGFKWNLNESCEEMRSF